MIQGLYAAANGMLAVESRQAIIANNIANASTPGFKRQLAVQRGYYQAYFPNGRRPPQFDQNVAPGGGIKTIETFSNWGAGIVSTTSNPLDVALGGPGFLRVQTANGIRYTRNGHMTIGADGYLETLAGEKVLDTGGAKINAAGGIVKIDEKGNVYVGDEQRAQLSVVEFPDPHALTREGNTLFSAPDAVVKTAGPAKNTQIEASSIENSNVQLPSEMIEMTMALRAYGANEQVVHAVNESVSRMISAVGGVS